MISSQRKRVVFCGNWTSWTPKWNFLDGDNSEMSYSEFIGSKYMKENILDVYTGTKNKKHLDRIARNRNKINRVIDSSEYVVRCSHGKSSNPTSKFNFDGHPCSSYGSKTNIVGFSLDFGKSDKTRVIKNHFNDLQVRFGLDSGSRKQDEKWLLKAYGSKMVASQMDEFHKNESWLTFCNFYKRVLSGEYTDESLRRRAKGVKDSISIAESFLGESLKSLSIEDYNELCEEVKKNSISYDELKFTTGGKKWSKRFFEFHDGDNPWMKTDDERRTWMDLVKSNFHINRGLELIWMIMKDKRFDDYDKYIIGVMGINECFNIGLNCHINQWGEYLWMSDKIMKGQLLFLPEHVDVLYEELEGCINNTSFNITKVL